jgi:hypothetical protein
MALALETKRIKPEQVINTAPGSLVVGPLVVSVLVRGYR